MNRRDFLTFGGALSITALSKATPTNESKPLPEFKTNEILTAEQLNALVQRINQIETRNHGK